MKVAVVGATGAVGSTILELLRERAFPADELVPFASERSAGRTLDHGAGEGLVVRALSPRPSRASTSRSSPRGRARAPSGLPASPRPEPWSSTTPRTGA
ncbi:MAG: hypothetical protein WKF31_10245 [Thermoleophilaceae bacterium]